MAELTLVVSNDTNEEMLLDKYKMTPIIFFSRFVQGAESTTNKNLRKIGRCLCSKDAKLACAAKST
jgi:hypothetical protein